MKSIKYIAIIAFVIFIAFIILKETSKARIKHSQTDNQAVLIAAPEVTETTKTPQKHNQKKPVADQSIVESTEPETKNEEKEPESDYISAYRDWQYFENCYTDIEDINNKKDPLQTLSERFVNNNRESQSEPTTQQNSYYQYHVDVCKTLIAAADDITDYYAIRYRLKTRYEGITPKSEQEKQLAHAIQMLDQLQYFQSEFAKARNTPSSSLSVEELNAIINKIEILSNELLSVYEANTELTEEQIEDITKITNQIDVLNSTIQSNSSTDSKLMAELNLKVEGQFNSIDDYLHRVRSPDAFLLLAKVLYRVEYFKKKSSVIQKMKSQTGLYDPYYINILNKIVLPLVACSMDYPCDAQSDFVLSYCLGLRDSMFNQACGRSLEDFYFNFYIGPNQLNDVNIYFNYLVGRYAQ